VYAIVDIGGRQFKATPDAVLRVPRMATEVGGEVTLDKVMLWSDDNSVEIGSPFVEGKTVQAEVIRHGKDKKIIVFKKKRRKKYRRKNGHRQQFTELRLTGFAG
jgi:large subunit ribosomal protein L21